MVGSLLFLLISVCVSLFVGGLSPSPLLSLSVCKHTLSLSLSQDNGSPGGAPLPLPRSHPGPLFTWNFARLESTHWYSLKQRFRRFNCVSRSALHRLNRNKRKKGREICTKAMASSHPNIGFPTNDNSSFAQHPYYMNGKLIISVLVILFLIVLFIIALHIYAKWFWCRSDRRQAAAGWRLPHVLYFSQEISRTGGLDKAIVESLPIFAYKVQLPEEEDASVAVAIECAVCLSEFQEDEKCRLLPKCSHSFHTDCIDMWFLSNTTCPLCRTSAEPSVLEEEHDAASSMACLLPHQDRFDHMERLGSGFTNGEHQGASGFAGRERLGSAYGTRDGLGYGNRDESGFNDGRERNVNSAVDQLHTSDGEAFLRRQLSLQSPGARSWRRSISDRFPNISQGVQFPTNVLFWGNHSHVSSCVNPEHWQIGGRSLPHIVVDVPRPQDSLLTPCSTSGSPSRCSSVEHQSGPSPSARRPFNRLNSLKRLLSREKKVLPLEHGMSSCGSVHSTSANS